MTESLDHPTTDASAVTVEPGVEQTPGSEPVAAGARRRLRAEHGLSLALRAIAAGPLLILVVLCLVMTFSSDVFLTQNNILNLGVQSAVTAVLAMGMLVVIVTQGIDLSVGSVVALTGTVGALFATDVAGSGVLTIMVMVAAGVTVGLVNGGLLVVGRAPHAFVVTLATLGIARGLALLLSDGTSIVGMPQLVLTLGSEKLGPIPWPVVVAAFVALVFWVLTTRTVWGRWVYAVGGNPEAAKRNGMPVGRVLISVYVASGLCAAIAGILTSGQTNVGAPNSGFLLELDAITAVIIGGASFFGGRGTVVNVLVGALVLGVIRNGLNLLGVSPFYQTVAVGVMILIAIELDVLRGYLEERIRVLQARRANA